MKSDIEALRQALAEHVRFHDDGLGCTADSEEWQAACSPRTIARLLDALELAQRDAARYQWLRAEQEFVESDNVRWKLVRDNGQKWLDEAIDAAMKDKP